MGNDLRDIPPGVWAIITRNAIFFQYRARVATTTDYSRGGPNSTHTHARCTLAAAAAAPSFSTMNRKSGLAVFLKTGQQTLTLKPADALQTVKKKTKTAKPSTATSPDDEQHTQLALLPPSKHFFSVDSTTTLSIFTSEQSVLSTTRQTLDQVDGLGDARCEHHDHACHCIDEEEPKEETTTTRQLNLPQQRISDKELDCIVQEEIIDKMRADVDTILQAYRRRRRQQRRLLPGGYPSTIITKRYTHWRRANSG